MYSRKYSIGRNILRIFEIAFFFAISVVGYGLLGKTSSLNAKSKSREHASGLQQSLSINGHHRELKVLSGTVRLPVENRVTNRSNDPAFCLSHVHPTFCVPIKLPDYLFALHDSAPLFGNTPPSLALPGNLLQQNPVLLI
ncbi:MAG: hypothetical protein HGB00_00210 [Chlorobiaceae bacterium]|nr:hypothetical protein [Chlorobiaceae bacterium]